MPPQDEQVGQNVDHIDRFELAGDTDRQTFVGELVASGTCDHRVCDPRRSHRTRHDCAAPAAAGCKIRWSARACRAWAAYGGPSAPRVAKYARPAWVDCPARLAQQFSDPTIAIAAVLPSKLDNIGGETLLVLTTARDLALFRATLPERRAGATLGDMQLRSDLLNAGTATRGT